MIEPELRNWAWCEHCLEWRDADEVALIEIKEDVMSYNKAQLKYDGILRNSLKYSCCFVEDHAKCGQA